MNWNAVGSTIPIMLALTFFSVLHVPINIPALALITGEDNADLDRELRAHGWSNTLSGLCGSVQVRLKPPSLAKSLVLTFIELPCIYQYRFVHA